jgi:hypothetical protein
LTHFGLNMGRLWGFGGRYEYGADQRHPVCIASLVLGLLFMFT